MSELEKRATEIERGEALGRRVEIVEFKLEKWPKPPAAEAFYGVAGRWVRAIEPHTEADPIALLVQLLVAAGNAIGRDPHCKVEADWHGLNLFAVFVGETAKGRKGTSWGHAKQLIIDSEPSWADRNMSGLSSGEGLIWPVRDPIEKVVYDKETKEPEVVVTDPGVEDKRLLVYEAEFASLLRVLRRDGNTLSATVRRAWDTGDLQTLTKNSPARATGAHISMIGHVTKDELLREMDSTEQGNGFGNRFLWFCVKRARILPEGGALDPQSLVPIKFELKRAIEWARGRGDFELRRDDDARRLWADVYPDLSAGQPGMAGAMLARAEAQVLRLSALYALLDRSPKVRVEHLGAALALWEYAEASVRYVFGASLGDPVADTIFAALKRRPEGMSRTEMQELCGRHVYGARLDNAIRVLVSAGKARLEEERTGGRPKTRLVPLKPLLPKGSK